MNAIEQATQALLDARRSGKPAGAVGLADEHAAYAVQDRVAQALGWRPTGQASHWKSGGPSREQALTHALLPPAGVWASPASSGRWPFRMQAFEAEVALRLGEAVDAERAARLSLAEARSLVDAMTVSIELIDSRWAESLDAPATDRLADVQSHGALVLGPWVPFDAQRDWAAQRCRVQVGWDQGAAQTGADVPLPGADVPQPGTDDELREFVGTHSLGDPAWVLPAWLRHATRHGQTLAAGSVVSTGTWCGLMRARPGQTVTVQFEGIGSASVLYDHPAAAAAG